MTTATLPVTSLIPGNVYQLRARSFSYGVWDGQGFVGIRTKFASRYLFVEYPYTVRGSAYPIQDLGPLAPPDKNIPLSTTLGHCCQECYTPVQETRDGWKHVITTRYNKASDEDEPYEYDHRAFPMAISNQSLFSFLEEAGTRLIKAEAQKP